MSVSFIRHMITVWVYFFSAAECGPYAEHIEKTRRSEFDPPPVCFSISGTIIIIAFISFPEQSNSQNQNLWVEMREVVYDDQSLRQFFPKSLKDTLFRGRFDVYSRPADARGRAGVPRL